MPALFIAGTDTNVGKTIVTAGLAAALARQGCQVGVYKPVQTGSSCPLDLKAVTQLAGKYAKSIECRASYCFPVPATPWVADTLANGGVETIEPDRLLETAQDMLSTTDWLIVEGAGGIRVPITQGLDMLGLMSALGFPVLLVVRPNLGTINHTRLTLDALLAAGLNVAGIVVSGMPDKTMLANHPDKEAMESLQGVFEAYLPLPKPVILPQMSLQASLCEADLDCFGALLKCL